MVCRRLLLAVAVCAITLGGLSAAPASAAVPGVGEGITSVVVNSDAVPRELTGDEVDYANFVAKHSNAESKDVYRSIRYSQYVADLAAALGERYPDSFLEAGVSDRASDPYDAVVTFAGPVPAGALTLIRALPFDIEVQSGYPFSANLLNQVQLTAYKAVFSSPFVADSASNIDPAAGSINISATLGQFGSTETLQQLVKTALTAKYPGRTLPQVNIVAGTERVTQADVLTGGATLSFGTSATVACTAGFTVRVSNNTRRVGLFTAAHCADDLGYERRNVLSYQGELLRNGGNTDVQWHEATNGETVRNYIIYESNLQTRRVVGTSNPAKGAYLCRWGDTTKAKCDYVRSTVGVCRDGYCNLYDMYNRNAASGDSGGPWWEGSGADAIARGIHSGAYSTGGSTPVDCFSPIGLASAQMGVSVFIGQQ